MILFLSSSFLRRVRMQWKSNLTGFLIGDRNLYFFYPDSIIETAEINAVTIDSFLAQHAKESLQLLGFLTPSEHSFIPGYVQLITTDVYDPERWAAVLNFPGEEGEERRPLEIRKSAGP